MSVNKKLLEVMKELGDIDASKMEFKSTKYSYLSENEITPKVKELFEKHGLVITPVDTSFENTIVEGNVLSTVQISYRIYDVDDEEKCTVVAGIGQGMDKGDKAVPKACTAALKQMFRHLLLIASPDRLDPDNTASEAYRAPKAPVAQGATLTFGKYQGQTLEQVYKTDPKYVEWVAGKEGEFQELAKKLIG